MQPAPTGHFTAALRAAIVERALSRRRIEVRVLIGQFPPKGVDAAAFLKELTDPARDIPGSGVTVSVLAMRTCTVLESCNSFSWNHGKFIVVDGREVIVGGHNLWTEDYLTDNPVHDLSMQVKGPAAASASRFADRLWSYVCSNLTYKDSISLVTYVPGRSEPGQRCPVALAARRATAGTGGVEIMGIGRLGAGITDDFANQSGLARDLMFGAARKTIANQSKLWMVDDRIFYIGSDNMYPVNLQEFGFIVDDRKAVDALIESYWNPLWQWSRRAAVSGEGVEKCIFREIIK